MATQIRYNMVHQKQIIKNISKHKKETNGKFIVLTK